MDILSPRVYLTPLSLSFYVLKLDTRPSQPSTQKLRIPYIELRCFSRYLTQKGQPPLRFPTGHITTANINPRTAVQERPRPLCIQFDVDLRIICRNNAAGTLAELRELRTCRIDISEASRSESP